MVQNIIALIIFFAAAAISVYSVIKSITSKKPSGCDGCSACEVKDVPTVKKHHQITKMDLQKIKFAPTQLK